MKNVGSARVLLVDAWLHFKNVKCLLLVFNVACYLLASSFTAVVAAAAGFFIVVARACLGIKQHHYDVLQWRLLLFLYVYLENTITLPFLCARGKGETLMFLLLPLPSTHPVAWFTFSWICNEMWNKLL